MSQSAISRIWRAFGLAPHRQDSWKPSTSVDDYEAARSTIDRVRRDIGQLLSHYDVLVGAAAPGAAPRGLAATGDPILSRAWQALGLAAATVPGLRSTGGLPRGIQVIAQSELVALRAAAWIERVLADRSTTISGAMT